jgi:hypothetical protein
VSTSANDGKADGSIPLFALTTLMIWLGLAFGP